MIKILAIRKRYEAILPVLAEQGVIRRPGRDLHPVWISQGNEGGA